jgi:protein-L-isoaspartate(D-aspartate) O-methyltransferase
MHADVHADDPMLLARREMTAVIRRRGLNDESVLRAMDGVRRHRFFLDPVSDPAIAYGDFPVAIGHGQTISQPYIVAYMTALLRLAPGDRVLEVGTGSGYQAAVLAAYGAAVFTLERIPALARHAQSVLAAEGFEAVRVRCADGYDGWEEESPFDAILVACAPPTVPEALERQLAEGGRMVVPVGEGRQRLVCVRRRQGRISSVADLPVRFVPMVAGIETE